MNGTTRLDAAILRYRACPTNQNKQVVLRLQAEQNKQFMLAQAAEFIHRTS